MSEAKAIMAEQGPTIQHPRQGKARQRRTALRAFRRELWAATAGSGAIVLPPGTEVRMLCADGGAR